MARTVANLAVSISARTRGLSKGLKRAKAEVAGFAAGVAKTVAGIGAIGLVTGGAVALRVKNQISSLSALAKTARKLSDIEPTSLIALRDLAQQSGVEVKTLDMGLQRMLRRVQEASAGKGEAVSVLKELGLDAKALIKLKPDEQFVKVAQAMKKIEGDGRNLARLMKLFDSEGVALGNTFDALGKDGLKPFIAEVKRTGRAITENQLKPIESVEDRWFRLTQRVGGLFTELAKSISKPLNAALGDLEKFLAEPEQVEAFKDAFKDIGVEIQNAGKNLRQLARDFEAFKKSAEQKKDKALGIGARIVKGTSEFLAGHAAQFEQNFENLKNGRPQQREIADESLDKAATIIRPARNALFDMLSDLLEGVDSMAKSTSEGVERVVKESTNRINQAVSNAVKNENGGSSGKVMRLERNGRAIPFGPELGRRAGPATGQPAGGMLLDESRKQTNLLKEISRKSIERSQSKLVIQVAG